MVKLANHASAVSPVWLSVPPPIPPFISSSGESAESALCPLTVSPSTLVVRFGDPVAANCSVSEKGFPVLGWIVPLHGPEAVMDRFLVWRVNRMTNWSISPVCYALSEQGGQCDITLPVTVYKPPDSVSISFKNHSGPMFEGHKYTLQCKVQDVAPAENLTVTFYRGQTAMGHLQSSHTEKTPVTEIFCLDITPSKEDNGVQYWCEAKLELGPEGPQHPPVVISQKLNATVFFGPHLICPKPLQVIEGKSLICEVRGNPQPSVIWFRDGQVVALPSHLSKKHAGKYTVCTDGFLGQKNFTVEVEVLAGSGAANSCNRYFLLAALFIQMINSL
ncbi:vascular cell adhesion protein 1-like [Toxotes jaculatrix]|uniref:vascular cell adhesion protein 1-like n=1 Tax=Toxotes jaculatrix TaxID=941984 RepID=UPI001B3AB9A6|nr:vascular cell adhesion protein 1-like [Toxotes jaculatrix]